jgi:hypothetical protein
MTMHPTKFIVPCAALWLACTAVAASAGDSCGRCGNHCAVRKVCRLVEETKEIEEVCYGCQCEDICLPKKSCRGSLHHDAPCAAGCPTGSCEHRPECKVHWFTWKPSGAKLRTRKNLVKYVRTKKVPAYTWKVEEVCNGCLRHDDALAPPDEAPQHASEALPARSRLFPSTE